MFATRSEGSDDNENLYNYIPTEWVCILFVALFAISTTLHIVQAVRYRLWWLFLTAVLSGITEILGWSGRLWSSQNPLLRTPFLIQVSTLIMAPTYLVATNFMVLGKLIRWLGPQYCRMSQKWYAIVFLACDTVALVVQSVGGGIASGTHPDLGGHIALGGIVLQLVALVFFTFIAGEFLLRFAYDRPIRHSHANNPRGVVDRNIGLTITGLSTMTILLLIRSIYRTIELSDGWTGTIISTQWLFNAFDGAMIVLATFTLNFLHPGVLLRGYDRVKVGPSTEKIVGSPSFQSV
ncbi:RTA1-like protein [Lactarius deliciosus]|nr:RTA1-like protein [Lactarius deliciosus]